MSNALIAALGFAGMGILIAIRVPIGFAMGIAGVVGYSLIRGWNSGFNLLLNSPWRTAGDYTLSVVPMFILMGVFATAGGMSGELFRATSAWFGHRRGGLALASILTCGGFAAVNGSSVATAATMTTVALPEMRRAGYDPGFSAGLIAAGGTLGIIIPPSVIMLLYAILTEQNVTKLFAAGILPGILSIFLYICLTQFIAWRRPAVFPTTPRLGYGARLATLKDVWATLLLFILVVGAMLSGMVTVTEAASVGALSAMLIGVLRGRLGLRQIIDCLVQALRTSAAILTIAIGAYLFGYFLTITQTTQNLTAFLLDLDLGPYPTLCLIIVVYLILGALMDELAIMLLTVPIVYPAIIALGFDPIWFGVVLVITISLGMIMPPIGMNVFVINGIARDVSLVEIYRGVTPFIAIDIVKLVILCAFPMIALWIPNLTP